MRIRSFPKEVARAILILGGMRGRNVPEEALRAGVEVVEQDDMTFSIPPRIQHVVVFRSFVGHRAQARLREQAGGRVKVYWVWGSQSAIRQQLRAIILSHGVNPDA